MPPCPYRFRLQECQVFRETRKMADAHGLYLESNPQVSALYAPWLTYDDNEEKVLHGYFTVPERQEFSKQDPLAMFNFIATKQVFPESAIFRIDALHSIMMSHSTAPYQWFLMLYALCRNGNIVFETEPFYYEVAVVKSHLKRDSRINIDVNISHLDQFRAGVEIMLGRMMMDYGQEKIPDQMRGNLHEILLNYAHNRLVVGFNRALAAGQFMQAVEYTQRVMLWRGKFDPDLINKSHAIYGAAAIQAVAELFKGASWLREVYVCGFKQPGGIISGLQERLPDVTIQAADENAVMKHEALNTLLVLVKNAEDRKPYLQGGILSGNVVSLAEVAEYYQLTPAKRHFNDL